MSKEKKIKLNLNAKIVGYELCCIKCRNLIFEGDENSFKDTVTSSLDQVVFNEYSCEKCGCNTFNVDCFIKLNVEKLI